MLHPAVLQTTLQMGGRSGLDMDWNGGKFAISVLHIRILRERLT